MEFSYFFVLSLLCWYQVRANQANSTLGPDESRGRFLSLFSVLTFKNGPCTSATGTSMQGTCYTSSECTSKGGSSGGNCAAGFGVCCLFMTSTCGSAISQNCTYVQNPGYPSTYTTTGACSFTVNPIQPGICQLRLDFTNFVTGVSTAAPIGSCTDTFQVTTPSGVTTPVICGSNTGLHMYVDTGDSTSSSTLSFTIASTTGTVTWKIKVSQIECYSPYRAPENCLQYFTGVSGSIKSYGYGGPNMLQSLQYNNCIRQEQGYCAIDYSEASQATPDSFQLGTGATTSLTDTNCNTVGSMIVIPTSPSNAERFCGAYLSDVNGNTTPGTVRDVSTPFILGVTSLQGNAIDPGTGFNLVYTQVPC